MQQNKKGIGDIITAVTIAVLFVVILSLVVFAARGYQYSVEMQDNNSNKRAVIAYVTNCIRDNNTGSVTVEDRSGEKCLIISSNDGYEQRFWLDGDRLLEEFSLADIPLDPDNALEIGHTEIFNTELYTDSVIKVTTSEGTSYISIER